MSNSSQPLIILVHPGSLCGSYETCHDFHPDWKQFARSYRSIICEKFRNFDGLRVVVLGTDLDDEIERYPEVKTAVAAARDQVNADAQEDELINGAREIWQRYGNQVSNILVTGIWCDEPDGCAWTLFKALKDMAASSGIEVTLDPDGAYDSDIDELPSLEN